MTLNAFKTLINGLNNTDKRLIFVKKFLFHGIPHVFENRVDEYFEFRNQVANRFNVAFHEVFIVGSAKLGFSYHKQTVFSYDSDIDVVIVNEKLFEYFYSKISDYQYQLDSLHKTVSIEEKSKYNIFLRYLVKGWMRPDLLPTSFQVDVLKTEWFDYFQSISYNRSAVGNYKVAAGLFKNYEYLEKYYTKSIADTYDSLIKK